MLQQQIQQRALLPFQGHPLLPLLLPCTQVCNNGTAQSNDCISECPPAPAPPSPSPSPAPEPSSSSSTNVGAIVGGVVGGVGEAADGR